MKGEGVQHVPTDRVRVRQVVAGGLDARYMGADGGTYDVRYSGDDEA